MTPAGRHHFFVEPSDVQDGIVQLTGAEAHHASRVLRVHPGEAISVADDSGRVLDAVVIDVGQVVRAEVRDVLNLDFHKPALTLVQAVAKGDRMDDVISKAVEIGVLRIVPFIAARTVVRWDSERRGKAHERWNAVARAAAKQCRAPHLSVVAEVAEAPSVALGEGAPVLVLHEEASMRLRDALPEWPPDGLVLVVGPEGGLAPAEIDCLRNGDASIVTLGDRVLRTETAGLVAAAIVAHAYGSLG